MQAKEPDTPAELTRAVLARIPTDSMVDAVLAELARSKATPSIDFITAFCKETG